MRITGPFKLGALIGILLLLVLACVPFFLQRIRKFERQRAAVRFLYHIHQSQARFKIHQGRYGTLIELSEAGLLEAGLELNNTSTYKYWVSDLSPSTVCVHADRMAPQAGNCDFILCEDGVLDSRCSKEPGSVPRGPGAQTN
jgi:hypothetical protein